MDTTTKFSIILVGCLFRLGLSASKNILSNPSFEIWWDWQVRERISMWDTLPADPEHLNIIQGPAHTGSHLLMLHPKKGSKSQGVFLYQYIAQKDIPEWQGRPLLKLTYWIKGKYASNVEIHIDISYLDSAHVLAVIPVEEIKDDEVKEQGFVRRCSIIPAYGDIRSITVHIVLEKQCDEPVYMDDVTLDVMETIDDDSKCPIFVDAFPKKRQILENFLMPTVPFSWKTITLCTQMTYDRLDNLIATARVWNGPISVSLLMLKEGKKSVRERMQELTRKYYENKILSNQVAFHIVLEDELNEKDKTLYPVNFLRNVALRFAVTTHVFFVDADISPGFSERQAWGWMVTAQLEFRDKMLIDETFGEKIAYIAPVFNVKAKDVTLPSSKEELLTALNEQKDKFEVFMGVSHSMVKYGKWRTENKPYQVTYQTDNEPYFIVFRDSPMMNDLFAGYGRDKCVYAKELDFFKYMFIVLPEAFLLNKLDPPGTKTIMSRSRGLSLRVFQSLEFHWRDLLDSSYSTTRYNYLPYKKQLLILTNRTKCLNDHGWETEEHYKHVKEKERDDGGLGCTLATYVTDLIGQSRLPVTYHIPANKPLRKDILVEKLMQRFRIGSLVELPQLITGSLRVMLPLMHPDVAIALVPNSTEEEYIIEGPFEVFKSSKNVSAMLDIVKKQIDGPAIIVVNVEEVKDIKSITVHDYIVAALVAANDKDLVLFQGVHPDLLLLHQDMCDLHPNWKIYTHPGSNILVMKSEYLVEDAPLKPMKPPRLTFINQPPKCEPANTKVDIILMTRNRPLQTYAFLDSLNKFASNVNKVWVLYRADDTIFEEGYDLALSCMSRSLTLEKIRDYRESGKPGFGQGMVDIVHRSEAQYLVLAVDEIIWMTEVDLQYAACMLKKGEGQFFSVQLRLGENLNNFPQVGSELRNKRMFPMAHNPEVLAYWPKFMTYDNGYVLNVDGTLVSRQDFITDLGDSLIKHRHPGDVENGWVYKKNHLRSKNWHLTFKTSKLVNNGFYHDGGMMNQQSQTNITEKAYEHAKIFLEQRKRIDIIDFVNRHKNPRNAHIHGQTRYQDINC